MNKLHRSLKLLAIVIIVGTIIGAIIFSAIKSYAHPHFSNELGNKAPAGNCNYTVYYEDKTGHVKTRAHEVKMLRWWAMLYPCTGSDKRIISIPVQRIIQIERD